MDEIEHEGTLRRTWRCCVCDALHVDDHSSMERVITWTRHDQVARSRRRWIDAATSCLDPDWNGTPDDLCAALDALRAENERLRTAARDIVERLDAIVAHPSYQAQIATAHAHGVRYDGPTWVEPRQAVLEALGDEEVSE